MSLAAGDAFLFDKARVADGHLWVVVSDPSLDAGRILLLSVTTYASYKEDCCLLDYRDHGWITHGSCVAYNFARVTSGARLDQWVADGLIRIQRPFSPDVLARIRRGAASSTRIKIEQIAILEEQQLV